MTIRRAIGVALFSFLVPLVSAAPSEAQRPQQPQVASVTFEQAQTAVEAAQAEASRNQWNLTIVITDAAGVPIYLRRMPNATARSYDIAMGKIRTSIATGMHTEDYGRAVSEGRMQAIPDGITFEGGYLLRVNGEIVGAMSASGARGTEDAQAVRAGMAAIGIQP